MQKQLIMNYLRKINAQQLILTVTNCFKPAFVNILFPFKIPKNVR